jgi:hypothetical protein
MSSNGLYIGTVLPRGPVKIWLYFINENEAVLSLSFIAYYYIDMCVVDMCVFTAFIAE